MAHGRYDLTEFEWKTIQPLLPNKPRGVPRVDDRRVRRQVSWDKLVVLNKGGFLVHRIKTENWNETNI